MAKYKTCVLCGEESHERNFSAHRNNSMHETFGFCKECINRKENVSDKDSTLHILRLMNIPYIQSVWDNLNEEESEVSLTKYFQVASFQRGKYYNFIDGDISAENNTMSAIEPTKELVAKWGKIPSDNDYGLYESIYDSLTEIKPPNGKFEVDRYTQCVKIKVALDEAISGGDSNDIKRLQDTYEKQLSALGLNIIKNEEEEKSLGERIKFYEEHDPIPEPDTDLEDVDRVNHYIKRNFLLPVKRMFGQATEEEIQEIYNTD